MRPDERLPTKRTASSGSRVPPAETSDAPPAQRAPLRRAPASIRSTAAAISSGSAMRPAPTSPSASSPSAGPDELDAARAQASRRSARVAGCSHMRTFIAGATSTGPCVRESGLGEEVVGEPVRQPRERVRRQRRDDEQVGVLEMRVRVVALRLASEREEGLGRDEPLGALPSGSGRRRGPPGRAGARACTPCRPRSRR